MSSFKQLADEAIVNTRSVFIIFPESKYKSLALMLKYVNQSEIYDPSIHLDSPLPMVDEKGRYPMFAEIEKTYDDNSPLLFSSHVEPFYYIQKEGAIEFAAPCSHFSGTDPITLKEILCHFFDKLPPMRSEPIRIKHT